MCNRLDIPHEQWRKKMCLLRKELSVCLKGNHFTRVLEEGFSVAQKSFASSNTARYNEWALRNFELWKSQVAVEDSFPCDVLLTDDPKLLFFCLRKYVSNTARCNKWALSDFG